MADIPLKPKGTLPSTTDPSDHGPTKRPPAIRLRLLLHRLAKLWLRALVWTMVTLLSGAVVVVFGLSQSVPLTQNLVAQFMRHNPVLAISLMVFVTCSAVLSWLITRLNNPKAAPDGTVISPTTTQTIWLYSSAAFASLLFVLLIVMAGTIQFRAPWCPSSWCPPPPVYCGPHTVDLEICAVVTSAPAWELPASVRSVVASNLPQNAGAVFLPAGKHNVTAKQVPFRIVLGIQRLSASRYPLIIEQVDVQIQLTSDLPVPLNVWLPSVQRDYSHNLYDAIYSGQTAGSIIPAALQTPTGEGEVQLVNGEEDTITIGIGSAQVASFAVSVRVTYRLANQSVLHTLTLQGPYQVVFSDVTDWHPYVLLSGKLQPSH